MLIIFLSLWYPAYNPQNPRKGEIINRIGGEDVYKGNPVAPSLVLNSDDGSTIPEVRSDQDQ